MTAEEIIALGANARALLDSENFKFFVSDELERTQQALFNTQPHEGDLRNELYHRHYGITQLLDSITAYIQAAEQILKEEDD